MGFFKEIYCAECGCKTMLLRRTKLADGNYVCSKCTTKVPFYIQSCMGDLYTKEDFKELLRYMEYSTSVLRPKFNETLRYGDLHVDENNKLLYIEHGFFKEPLILELKNLSSFDLNFKADTVTKRLIGDIVTGDVIMNIEMDKPMFHYSTELELRAKAKAQTALFSSTVTYDNPKKMQKFLARFSVIWSEVLDERAREIQMLIEKREEIEKAKALFMIDDLDNVSPETLKEQRNRLIKIYHPDASSSNDTKYAQKINDAYNVLKSAI